MTDDFDDTPFKSYETIERFKGLHVTVTEKIHGSNAQILVSDDGLRLKAGSRNRWLSADHDNYGFAKWVDDNREPLLAFLGPGRHFGEWYGAGIGPGYGLQEKRLALFNAHRWSQVDKTLFPPGVDVVPVLYVGAYTIETIEGIKAKLKADGSVMVPGYKKPEGVVINFHELRGLLKSVFDKEETGWDRKEPGTRAPAVDDPVFEAKVNVLLQPIRLEKLLMRDETYLRDFPSSLPALVRDYVADLLNETPGPVNDFVLAAAKKKAFAFVKAVVKTMQENLK